MGWEEWWGCGWLIGGLEPEEPRTEPLEGPFWGEDSWCRPTWNREPNLSTNLNLNEAFLSQHLPTSREVHECQDYYGAMVTVTKKAAKSDLEICQQAQFRHICDFITGSLRVPTPTCPVGLRPPSLSVRGYVLNGRVACWAVFITPSDIGRFGVRMLGPERGLLSLGDWGLLSRAT